MRLIHALPALAFSLAAASSPAAAQMECPVNVYEPSQLAQAGLMVQRAASADAVPDAAKALRDGMRYLQDDRRFANNMVGAGFLKAQMYIIWLHQEGAKDIMTNDELNAGGAKTATVDLVAAADSLLKAVEATSPACAEETAQWRQSKPWTDRLNKAYNFLGADQIDSAAYYAHRSELLNSESAFNYNLKAQLADKSGDKDAMLLNLEKAIELARLDETLAETQRQMMFQYAMTAQTHAFGDGAAQQSTLLRKAADTFMELLREDPRAREAAYAMSSVAEIIASTQDSVLGGELLGPMVADPSPYNDLTLLLGADVARMLERNDDAIALYTGALAQNPNIRDAVYFLAFMHYERRDGAKMLPLAQKLVELDPSNPDNYLILSEAYNIVAAEEPDAARKSELARSAQEAASKEGAMEHKVLVTQFERRDEGALIVGSIENRGKAAKSFSLTMEFLDAAGNVIDTKSAEVSSVGAGETGQYRIEAVTPGIVAYKYKEL